MDLRDKLKFWMALSNYVDMIVRGTSPLSLPDAIADSLSYVKAFGGTEQRNLPDNYLQRQFIYMMDGSYLLTDIVPVSGGKVEFDFKTTTIPSVGGLWLGTRDTSNYDSGFSFGTSTAKKFFIAGFSTRFESNQTSANDTRYKFVWDNGVASIYQNSSVIESNTFTPTETLTYPLVINGLNTAGTIGGNTAGIYLYSFKAWNAQGELIADYVPAVQKGTVPVVGFYDTVSKTFKTATAGTFAAGAEAVPTPDAPMDIVSNNGVLKARQQSGLPFGYTLLEYVSHSGSTVSLQIAGFDDATSEIYMGWKTDTASVSSNYQTVFAVWTDNQHNSWRMLTYLTDVEKYYVYGNSKSPATASGVALDTWHDLVCKSGQFIIDNTTYNTTVTSDLTVSTKSLTIGSLQLKSYYKYIKIKRQGEWIANFVPAKRNSDGEAGFYDLINNRFIGASYFTAGPEVSDPVEIYTDGTVETIKDSLNNTATAEMLLKVGDYQDEQEILSGVVTRKVGVKVLDGTENWVFSTVWLNYMYSLEVSDLYAEASSVASNRKSPYCTHFGRSESWLGGSQRADMVQAYQPTTGDAILGLGYGTPSAANLATFKAWLATQYAAGTPVIVVYPLATPTTESVAGQTLQVTDGDNTLEITQASLNNLELEAKYQAEQ